MMSFDGDENQWSCGRAGVVTLRRVGSIVRDLGEPCLHQSRIKVNKMLKPDKWQASFNTDGKLLGLSKVLKLIVLGGVDPSIRAEVWEFLLGCYAVSSTAEHRRHLRTARRERYENLVRQCQMMHSSVGTGSLAYIVGSKVMDMRTFSKDSWRKDAETTSRQQDANISRLETYPERDDTSPSTSHLFRRESCSGSVNDCTVRRSTSNAIYDSPGVVNGPDPTLSISPRPSLDAYRSKYLYDLDFPALPVTDLFRESDLDDDDEPEMRRVSLQHDPRSEVRGIDASQCNVSMDVGVGSMAAPSCRSHSTHSEIEANHTNVHGTVAYPHNQHYTGSRRTFDFHGIPQTGRVSHGGGASEERVSEWLWTLHRIVVDVVRTDRHLEFYGDTKNLARMSDILAVYAWVDPGTGYCQGMSDLLSPFVVLYEDNADAFWCFEMLLRRMRENFQMEGPTGVMKQLQTLWQIMKFADREIYSHLSHIGAESLHFAFPMLLVLFRRELSFNEVLCMWEMMWAADFDEAMASSLEENCLEPLLIQLPSCLSSGQLEEEENYVDSSIGGFPAEPRAVGHHVLENGGVKPSAHPFCGLRNCLSKDAQFHVCHTLSSENGADEMPIFCVAAILIINRQKIIRNTHSIDDLIKVFNDKKLKINVRRCIRTAIRVRRRYFTSIAARRERLENSIRR